MSQEQIRFCQIGPVERLILRECYQGEKLYIASSARRPSVNRDIPPEADVLFFDVEGIGVTPRGTIVAERLG